MSCVPTVSQLVPTPSEIMGKLGSTRAPQGTLQMAIRSSAATDAGIVNPAVATWTPALVWMAASQWNCWQTDAVRQGELFFSNGCLIRCHDDLM